MYIVFFPCFIMCQQYFVFVYKIVTKVSLYCMFTMTREREREQGLIRKLHRAGGCLLMADHPLIYTK